MKIPIYRERRHRQRSCDICHKSYSRCNKYKTWPRQNPGSKSGWTKVILTICLKCQPAYQSSRIMIMAEAQISNNGLRKVG